MKKQFYTAIAAPVLALALLSSCSKEEESIFDDSAANRLALAKTETAARLTADGGKWVMEYFCNDTEPGYLFVMTFNPSGAVEIAADHKWIGNTFRAETSLWEMIADNGPVLSFNSYNEVFHVFSAPEDITGPDAPTNPDRLDDNGNPSDINETGYGHNGDYEFVVMEGDSDHNNIRLLSKKRGYNIYMHRLPADTDPETYLAQQKAVADNLFSSKFSTQVIVDGSTGERFVINNAYSGIMEVYPEAGDAVMQTVKHNFITTAAGIRFSSPFSIPRADADADDYVIETFDLQPDGLLKSSDGSTIVTGGFNNVFKASGATWRITSDSFSGDMVEIFNRANRGVGAYRAGQSIVYIEIKYNAERDAFHMLFRTSKYSWNLYLNMDVNDDTVKFSYNGDADPNGAVWYRDADGLKEFIDALCDSPMTATYDHPYNMTVVSLANQNGVVTLNVR